MISDSFVLYRSYIDAVTTLPENRQLPYWKKFFEWALDDKQPDFSSEAEKCIFIIMSAGTSSAKSRHDKAKENGSHGGAPKKNQNARKHFNEVKTTENNLSVSVSDSVSDSITYTKENNKHTNNDGQPCAPAEGGARSAQKPKKKHYISYKDENGKYMLKEVEGDGE